MTSRSPSVCLAAAMRTSISASVRPRYFSGSAWRSPMLFFSKSVSRGMIEPIAYTRLYRSYFHGDRSSVPSDGGGGGLRIEAIHDVIKGVPLERFAPCGSYEARQRRRRHPFGSG